MCCPLDLLHVRGTKPCHQGQAYGLRRGCVYVVVGRQGPCGAAGVSVAWCSKHGPEVWEPNAEPLGDNWVSQL